MICRPLWELGRPQAEIRTRAVWRQEPNLHTTPPSINDVVLLDLPRLRRAKATRSATLSTVMGSMVELSCCSVVPAWHNTINYASYIYPPRRGCPLHEDAEPSLFWSLRLPRKLYRYRYKIKNNICLSKVKIKNANILYLKLSTFLWKHIFLNRNQSRSRPNRFGSAQKSSAPAPPFNILI